MTRRSARSEAPLLNFLEDEEEVQGEYFQVLDEAGEPVSISAVFVDHGGEKECPEPVKENRSSKKE